MMPVCRKKIKGSLTLEGQTGEGLEALGLRPKPGEGRCPFEPRQGGGPPPSQGQAWTRLIGVFEEGGPTRTLKRHGWPPFFKHPKEMASKALPWWGSRGQSPSWGPGRSPGAAKSRSRLPTGTAVAMVRRPNR